MTIDFKARAKNPIFWVNTALAIATPIFAYYKTSVEDFTSWSVVINTVLEAVKNPYVLGLALVGLWNNVINPVTKGIGD